jgi:RNA polymerase sigma-70 factor, ECF subfamily
VALQAAIEALPEGQRQAIQLLKLKELSLKEASLATGMSVAALKVASHRAIKRLRALLQGSGGMA